jgi:mannose-6-phosphate isomerase
VQVHPDDEHARQAGLARGKTEVWHILAAAEGARIAAGFREPVTERRLRESALSGEILELLAWQEARAGDTFFIPGGTVHAIGEGLVLCEIQQHCEVTYRLYDYGRPRELHLDDAVRVSHRVPHAARREAREGVLVACEHFTVEKVALRGAMRLEPRCDEWLVVLEGACKIAGQPAGGGEVWHAGSGSFEIAGEALLLRATAGG